jgi:hypothetical protein
MNHDKERERTTHPRIAPLWGDLAAALEPRPPPSRPLLPSRHERSPAGKPMCGCQGPQAPVGQSFGFEGSGLEEKVASPEAGALTVAIDRPPRPCGWQRGGGCWSRCGGSPSTSASDLKTMASLLCCSYPTSSIPTFAGPRACLRWRQWEL